MISIKNLCYCYPNQERPALKKINLDIKENEILGIAGRNASGKSTLARLLNGLIIPRHGQVEVDGLNTAVPENIRLIRQKVVMLFAEPDKQFVSNIVEEDVAFGPENLGLEANEIRQRVATALKMVAMEDFAKYPPCLLSGGQKQRVCIAGILAMKPKYMVLDEPTAMLDPAGKKEVRKILKQLKEQQEISIIIISHDFEELLQTDQLLLLDRGEIRIKGPTRSLLGQKDILRSAGLEALEISILVEQLNNYGYSIPEDILEPDRLVEELCRLR